MSPDQKPVILPDNLVRIELAEVSPDHIDVTMSPIFIPLTPNAIYLVTENITIKGPEVAQLLLYLTS